MSTALSGMPLVQAQAQTQSQSERRFDIPAQSLTEALMLYGRQSGIQVSADAQLVAGRRSQALSGDYTPSEALSRLLNGTGLSYRFSGNRVTLERAPATGEAIQLGAIRVEGATGSAGGNTSVSGEGDSAGEGPDAPYRTAGSRAHISADDVEKFKGTSVADIFVGVPGVISGNARNTGGVDLNIRGMQGQGRVPVVIDGSTQEHTTYRGYNGAAGRSYIDPDFIGSVDIEKGPSAAADATGATGGVARISTIKPADILKPDENWGIRVKAGFNGNSAPTAPLATVGGDNVTTGSTFVQGSEPDINTFWAHKSERRKRGSLLSPTGESYSVVTAWRNERFDVVAGYARRRNGNYYAGKSDDAAHPEYQTYASGSTTRVRVINGGLTAYGAHEEVLNTSLDNESFLIKGTLRLEDQTLELGYSKYRSAFGQIMPTQIWGIPYQSDIDAVDLDTYTARYNWKPAGSDLFDLKIDTYFTDTDNRINATYFSDTTHPAYYYQRLRRFGLTVSNTSRFYTDIGDFALSYGGAFKRERAGLPMSLEEYYEKYGFDGGTAGGPRMGWRRELSAFAALDWKPAQWATLSVSTRYNEYETFDRNSSLVEDSANTTPSDYILTFGNPIRQSASGWSPIVSLLVEPKDGLQFYVKHSQAKRLPSVFEGLSGFSIGNVTQEKSLRPEHAKSWEGGINFLRDDVFKSNDKLRLHLAYFDNHIDNYITRSNVGMELIPGRVIYVMGMLNLDYAEMRGLELSGEYDAGHVFGKLSWNHYTKTMFCGPDDGTLSPTEPVCTEGGLRNSYTLHQVPPKDSATLELGGRFFDTRLTLGGRATYIGERPVVGISDEDATDWDRVTGAIRPAKWNPYTLLDLYASYKLNDRTRLDASIDNVTDLYYMDALSDSLMPAPGRTFRMSLTSSFGAGDAGVDGLALTPFDGDWSGVYGGLSRSGSKGRIKGVTTAADGTPGAVPASESANQKLEDSQLTVSLGYNRQFANNVVVGIEADYAWGTWTGTTHTALIEPAELVARGDFYQAATIYELSDLATVRGRLGYASGKTLGYVTAGVASIKELEDRTQYRSTAPGATAPYGSLTAVWFSEQDSRRRSGWVLGAGFERAIDNHWSFKAEYLHAGFGDTVFRFGNATAGVTQDFKGTYRVPIPGTTLSERVTFNIDGTSNIINGRTAKNELTLQSLRVGVNYRF
ncbi:MAG: TonB-dependent receptor [Asticcacaulis sp.]